MPTTALWDHRWEVEFRPQGATDLKRRLQSNMMWAGNTYWGLPKILHEGITSCLPNVRQVLWSSLFNEVAVDGWTMNEPHGRKLCLTPKPAFLTFNQNCSDEGERVVCWESEWRKEGLEGDTASITGCWQHPMNGDVGREAGSTFREEVRANAKPCSVKAQGTPGASGVLRAGTGWWGVE